MTFVFWIEDINRTMMLPGTLLSVIWQPGWEGSLGEIGYMYIYGLAPLLLTWNYHSIVNWLYSNRRKKKVWCSEGSTVESDIAQSCLTLCDPMDCSLLGSPIHGIFWARVLEWVAISTTTALNSCLRIPSHSFIHSLENIEVRTIICLIQQSGFCRGPCLRDKQDNLFNVTLKGSENGTLNSQLVICQAWTWQNFPTEMLFVFWLSSPLDRTRSVSHSCFLFLSCIYISHFPGSP